MKQRHETEIKLEVRDLKALGERLAELGFQPVEPRHFERNLVFDFPDHRLRKAHCLLRLRFANGRGLLTFKGAPLPARRYKVRSEIEAKVEGGRQLREILSRAGLCEYFRYEKYRTVYARRPGTAGSSVLVLDETPIGNYVELEGSKTWIDRIARQLGYYRRDYIPASYADLYRQKCVERDKTPGNMVFPRRKS